MTYELAKQLKDAGFNQLCSCGYFVFEPPKEVRVNGEEGYVASEGVHNPTLSELIEACGKDFNFVCRNKDTGLWGAETHSGIVRSKDGSPEEAVARLWLELNKL